MVFQKENKISAAKGCLTGNLLSPNLYKAENSNSGKSQNAERGLNPMVLISEQDIIDTYRREERLSCQKYQEYLHLVKENPSFGYKRCAKLLGLPAGRIRWWHTKGAKRGKPSALKAVEKLKEFNLLPFSTDHGFAEDVFRMLGVIYGDGCLDKNLNTLSFISSVKENINLWAKDFVMVFPYVDGRLSIVEGGEYGHSYCIRTVDRSVIRFFVALGTPVGNKVANPYSLPAYFHDLPTHLKIAFFDGLFSSEVSVPRLMFTRYKTNYFKNFSLSMSKLESLEDSHKKFMNSVREELRKLGLKLTSHLRKDDYKNSHRKDGKKSFGYRIFFNVSIPNVLKFHKIFPLKYCTEKKQKLDKEIEKAINAK